MAEKILITCTRFSQLGGEARRYLEGKGYDLVVNPTDRPFYPRRELIELLPEISGAIVGLDQWDAELLSHAHRLRVLAKFGVGVDNIDLGEAKRRGIVVINAKGGNSNAVAEYTVALMLDVLRQVSASHMAVRSGGWPRYTGTELTGKTVGLLGFGDIAQKVALRLRGFETQCLAYDVQPNFQKAESLGVELVSQEELFRRSQILSIHIPSLPSTYHLVNAEVLKKLPMGSILINCARGAVVDYEALCDAVERGRLAGAGVDVYEQEPADPADRIFHTPGIVTTPHLAAETVDTYHNIILQTAKGIVDVLEGREPKNWLNR